MTGSTSDIVNHKVIQLYGLRRSGNHAVISWILDHHSGLTVHLNDVDNRHPNPYRSFGFINIRGLPFWPCKPKLSSYLKYRFGRERTYSFVWWDPYLNLDFIQAARPKQCLIVSHEDDSPTDQFLSQLSTKHDKFLGKTQCFYKVILMRDAFNLFASLIKSKRVDEDTIDRYIQLYKDYAALALSQQSQVSDMSNQGYIFISYNRWFLDSHYRQNLARKLDFETDGNTYEKVPKEGGGSTFDGLNLDGKAQDLKVLERWKTMVGHPLYQKVIEDQELRKFSDALFGNIVDSQQSRELLEMT